MGTMSIHVPKGTKTVDVLRQELGADIIKSKMSGNVAYLACRPENSDRTMGVVVITNRNNRDYFNFSFKVVDEDMGPFHHDCPDEILDLLDPVEEGSFAAEWRARCREVNEVRRNVTPGSVVRFAEPVLFSDGVERSEFVYIDKNKFRSLCDGVGVKIRDWQHLELSVSRRDG